MILFSFKKEPETRGASFPCLAFRWTFQIFKWGLGFIHQHQFKDGTWEDSHTAVHEVKLLKQWKFGTDHFYYDGPHCIYNFGPLSIQLGGNWDCKKCMGEIK